MNGCLRKTEMKKRLAIVLLAMAVTAASGCVSKEALSGQASEQGGSESLLDEVSSVAEETSEDEGNSSEAVSEEESKTELDAEVSGAYQVTFEHGYDESGEHAAIVVCDAEGEIWRYETSTEEVAQLDRFAMLGETATSVYFLENGVVKSLDIATGELQWELSDYIAGPGASLVDEDGTLYVCCYLGSFYMVISKDGEVLAHCPEANEEDLYWPYAMEFVGDKVRIYCESNEDAIVLVNKDDYSYTVE